MSEPTTDSKSKDGFFLKRNVFNDYAFVEALRTVAKHPLEIKIAWNVNRIIKQAQKHIDDGQKMVKAILDKHAEKDENGKFKQEAGNFVFKDEAAFKEEYELYGAEEVHFKSYKLTLDELAGVAIPPEMISALEPIIEE
jgi:hypothetical protein